MLSSKRETVSDHFSNSIPSSVVKRPSQVRVCVVESLEIPARSEALLTGQLFGLSGTVLVEPKYEVSSNNSSLYPARSIAHVENSRLPIKISNANNFPVKVFAGTCVGMAEIIDKKDL